MKMIRAILHFFVMAAFLGGIIAPACGFMWGGNFSVIEICTAQGLENRIVTNDQNEGDIPAHKTADQCQFCFSHANLVADIAPDFSLETIQFQAEKLKFRAYEDIVLSKLKTNISSRGPPLFS